jgi:hypothetical protein
MRRGWLNRILIWSGENSCWTKTQNLALRAGVELRENGRDVILVMDGDEQILCRTTNSGCRWRETWTALRRRFPLLAGF